MAQKSPAQKMEQHFSYKSLRKHQTDLKKDLRKKTRNVLFPLRLFHIISKNENKANGKPETNSQPVEIMKSTQQGYSKKENENRKALTKTDLLHKKIDSMKLSIEN